jgi:hypothetical protein
MEIPRQEKPGLYDGREMVGNRVSAAKTAPLPIFRQALSQATGRALDGTSPMRAAEKRPENALTDV